MRHLLLASTLCLAAVAGHAQTGQEKAILEMTRANWIAFRDYDGRQLVYFTHLEAWRCGIEKVEYSVNDATLGEEWQLQACDPANPNAVTTDMPYLSLPAGSAESLAVRLTYADGSRSAVETFTP